MPVYQQGKQIDPR